MTRDVDGFRLRKKSIFIGDEQARRMTGEEEVEKGKERVLDKHLR